MGEDILEGELGDLLRRIERKDTIIDGLIRAVKEQSGKLSWADAEITRLRRVLESNRELSEQRRQEIDLLAAAAINPHISTQCPSCARQSLYVDRVGHLRCSAVDCENPDVGLEVARLLAIEEDTESERAEQIKRMMEPPVPLDPMDAAERRAGAAVLLLWVWLQEVTHKPSMRLLNRKAREALFEIESAHKEAGELKARAKSCNP